MAGLSIRYLIVGLGNPGLEYSKNRHNIGYMVVEKFLKDNGYDIKDMKLGRGAYTNNAIFLMPDTYMNNSGMAVKHYLSKIGMNTSSICVIQDDMDLDIGRVLLKFNGGDNGHKGIKSINNQIGSNEYYRLRIGVGRPKVGVDPADYLLANFSADELLEIQEAVCHASLGLSIILRDGFTKAMNSINRRNNKTKKEEEVND